MKKIFLMTLAVAMVTVSANAQNPISGQTRNADTGEALPYVTVAIKGRGIGTISDREGRFEINGGKEGFSPADSIVFSHIGFDTEARTVSALTGEGQTVALRQGTYEIEEVVVTNRQSRLAKLGHSSGGARMLSVPFLTPQDIAEGVRRGREVGTAIKIKQDTKVLSLGFLINVNKYDEAKFRVSFYALDGETPGELLVNKDITFDLKGQVKDRFELDLSPYDIWLEGGQEVLVTLTLLDEDMTDKSAFWLNGVLLSGKGLFIRRAGEEQWTRMGGTTISMYLNARVYK